MEIVKDRVDERVIAERQQTTVTYINNIMVTIQRSRQWICLKFLSHSAALMQGLWVNRCIELPR